MKIEPFIVEENGTNQEKEANPKMESSENLNGVF
jgi:hypothetical protein